MDQAERGAGADLKGGPYPGGAPPEGFESRMVIGFIVAAVLVIGALVLWAM